MTKLLFHVSSLMDGSIEGVLLKLLNQLDPAKYTICLSVAHNLGDLEIHKNQVPGHVELHYILTERQSATRRKKIENTITLWERLYEELVMPVVKKRMHRTKLRELGREVDAVIDFDMTLAPYTGLFRDKKKVAWCHFNLGHYWDGNRRKLNKLAHRLGRYDKVIMLCDEMQESAIKLYPALQGRLIRIYSPVDSEIIQTLAQQPLEGHEYLLDDGYLLSIGHLSESAKDFSVLIKAYAACVKKYGIKQRLVIIAAGHDNPALEELAINEEVGELVVFEDAQANQYKWIYNSSLFVFCSRFESVPIIVVEALALGRPVISTAAPTGVKEILMNGKCGELVEPGNINALCESIYSLLDDDIRQQAFRQSSKKILAQFEQKNMISEFERILV